jgi:hypothetical protein
VQEEQSGVRHIACCDVGEFGSVGETQSPLGSLIMGLHGGSLGLPSKTKPDILANMVTR